MVVHLHDHDIVGLSNRLGVAVGIPRTVPAHGVATGGVAEAERVMSDAYFDRGLRWGAGYDIAERPADWGGFAQLGRPGDRSHVHKDVVRRNPTVVAGRPRDRQDCGVIDLALD